ncbi:hypothetical protein L228DRAFT_165665 [Xylona heveae TC161]|uniref:Uncharacterized protein n=1 Tax=Xylona heveae (strain CBS 132557 / TC161) TaxID=1328760 RepID=A0A165FJR9_XYLHT|nr:hypothetical protein L228DRAFT_165665 [Xylona heveae TC161]KZF21058.1 hypothetical protein L228DRAFT_165665 [Xylona heveae TC161]
MLQYSQDQVPQTNSSSSTLVESSDTSSMTSDSNCLASIWNKCKTFLRQLLTRTHEELEGMELEEFPGRGSNQATSSTNNDCTYIPQALTWADLNVPQDLHVILIENMHGLIEERLYREYNDHLPSKFQKRRETSLMQKLYQNHPEFSWYELYRKLDGHGQTYEEWLHNRNWKKAVDGAAWALCMNQRVILNEMKTYAEYEKIERKIEDVKKSGILNIKEAIDKASFSDVGSFLYHDRKALGALQKAEPGKYDELVECMNHLKRRYFFSLGRQDRSIYWIPTAQATRELRARLEHLKRERLEECCLGARVSHATQEENVQQNTPLRIR